MAPMITSFKCFALLAGATIASAQLTDIAADNAGANLAGDFVKQTIFGCPINSFLALETDCPVTTFPACAAKLAPKDYDAACCGSLGVFVSSVESCYSKNAPACLDTAAAAATLIGGAIETTGLNPCAAFAGQQPTATATPTSTPIGSGIKSKISSEIASKIASKTASETGVASKTATPTNAASRSGGKGWAVELGFMGVVGFGTLWL